MSVCLINSGVLKLTPAHDFVDFAIARKHSAELSAEDMSRSCINESGCLVNVPYFEGMDRFDARTEVIFFVFYELLLSALEKRELNFR